ncbi:hypothetical protein BN1708_001145 [Verticillium longisporum]|uniref:Uncharacterized protein n=1 Tax=Verticillium longisporum TaxID=100787 RepID=A0A0G4MGW6_VERLO|nr:hypothetical protein BN1708_001145 [Verticillium longisporum]
MDDLNDRLETFFEETERHRACVWAFTVPSAEDMAKAGFYLSATTTNPDTEANDDPFQEHFKGSDNCSYVESELFRTFQAAYVAKVEKLPRPSPSTPAKSGYHLGTPSRKSRAKRIASTMSQIMTVANLEPQPEVVEAPSPMCISISGAGMSMELMVNTPETPSKKRRYA